MKHKRKPTPPKWDLPDWHVPILLTALADHELVLKLRDQGGFGYRAMLDQIRENLQAKGKS